MPTASTGGPARMAVTAALPSRPANSIIQSSASAPVIPHGSSSVSGEGVGAAAGLPRTASIFVGQPQPGTTMTIGSIEQLQKSFGTNWVESNTSTLTNWIWIGAHNIKMLTLAINGKRAILRFNAMVGIIISTLTGTLSASQLNNADVSYYYTLVFTILSFLVATSSGLMKINQVQETLEEFIRIKQQWVFFTTILFSEFQLPIHLRQDALYLIWKYKNQYLDLLKLDLDISPYLRRQAEVMLQSYLNRLDAPEVKLTRFNNFLYTLLDMPKDVAFSTQLPNLMLDAIALNKKNIGRGGGGGGGPGNGSSNSSDSKSVDSQEEGTGKRRNHPMDSSDADTDGDESTGCMDEDATLCCCFRLRRRRAARRGIAPPTPPIRWQPPSQKIVLSMSEEAALEAAAAAGVASGAASSSIY